MDIQRRTVLTGAAATGALLLTSQRVLSEVTLKSGTLRTISDGHLTLPREMILGGLPEAELAPILARHGISGDRLEPPCNVTLYQTGDHTVLFDTGSGTEFQPTTGALLDNLDAAGVDPGEITHVVFTHAHPDHIWGLLDDFGDLAFPEADYWIGRAEWDYWINPETVNTIGEARAAFAVGAKRRLEEIEDRIEFFDDGATVLPGISALATFGHTPGHMGFEIEDQAVIVGDAIGNHHVAFARPDWASGSDQDQALGAETRAKLVDRLATDKTTIVGFHLPEGGIGQVTRDGDGYRFEPL